MQVAQPDVAPAPQSGCVHSAGGLTAIGAFFGGLPSIEDYLKRVYRVSRDNAAWRMWWKEALSALQQHPDGMCHLEDDLRYVEQCLDPVKRATKDLGPLKAPGKFLVKRLLQWARNHQVSMPRLPEASATVYAANTQAPVYAYAAA